MSELIYQPGDATPSEIPSEGQASRTPSTVPIETHVDIPAQPWRGFRGSFGVESDQAVGPWPETPIVLAPQSAAARSAREYIHRIAPDLPDEVRDSFVRGAGMFDLDVRGDEGLDELYDA